MAPGKTSEQPVTLATTTSRPAKSPNFPPGTITALAAGDRSKRHIAASSPAGPGSLLKRLAGDPDRNVRSAAAMTLTGL